MDLDPDSDRDPAIFVIDLQDANKKLIKKKSFSAYYFLKVDLHHFSKIKSQKEVTNQYKSMFFLLFLLDDRRIQIRICNTTRYRSAVSQLLMLHYLCGEKETVTFFMQVPPNAMHCSVVPWHNCLKDGRKITARTLLQL